MSAAMTESHAELDGARAARPRARHPHGRPAAAASSARRSRAPTSSSTSTRACCASRPSALDDPDRDYLLPLEGPRRARRSTARSPSSATSPRARLAQPPRDRRLDLLAPEPRDARASSSTRARSGTCSSVGDRHRARRQAARRAEPRLRGPRRRRARRGLGLGGVPRRRARYGLDNLVAIVDRNELPGQHRAPRSSSRSSRSAPSSRAFGWRGRTRRRPRLRRARARRSPTLPRAPGSPTAIIARTVRGKGLPSIEGARRPLVRATSPPTRSRRCSRELHGGAARGPHLARRWWCDDEPPTYEDALGQLAAERDRASWCMTAENRAAIRDLPAAPRRALHRRRHLRADDDRRGRRPGAARPRAGRATRSRRS